MYEGWLNLSNIWTYDVIVLKLYNVTISPELNKPYRLYFQRLCSSVIRYILYIDSMQEIIRELNSGKSSTRKLWIKINNKLKYPSQTTNSCCMCNQYMYGDNDQAWRNKYYWCTFRLHSIWPFACKPMTKVWARYPNFFFL
jgi:hypothetical protein